MTRNAAGWGFHFDDVVLTSFREAVPDAQACPASPPTVSSRVSAGARAGGRGVEEVAR